MASSDCDLDRRVFMGQCLAGLSASVMSLDAAFGQSNDRPATQPFPASQPASTRPSGENAWAGIRGQFSLEPNLTYLNTGGLGPSPRCVVDAITRSMADLERVCEAGREQFDDIRRKVCCFLNCDEDELAFTANTTESLNAVARGLRLKAGDEVLLTAHEHIGGALPWMALTQDDGVVVRTFEPGRNAGETLDRFAAALTPKTRAVSISHITCTLGMVLPVKLIVRLCREKGIVSIVDGAQAVGMLPVDLRDIDADFYATSGHKWLLGPKGTGLLYVSKRMLSHWHGQYAGAYTDKDYSLDDGRFERIQAARAIEVGTRNTPLVVGLGTAVDFLDSLGMASVARHGRGLTQHLRRKLQELDRVEVLTPDDGESAASILTFQIAPSPMDAGDWAARLLNEHRLRVRPINEHKLAAIRVCAHVFNDVSQTDRLVSVLTELLRR
jgi:selenocysteine lyase/cysteine desulfurase